MKQDTLFNGKILGLAAISAFAALSQAQSITVRVNGQPVYFRGAQPHMMDGQLIVPLRSVVEEAGGTVDWSSLDKTVTIQKGTNQIEIHVPSEVAKVNGTETPVNGPVHLMNGWTMIPIQFIADTFGARVEFEDNSNTQANLITSDTEPTMYPYSNEVAPTQETATPPSPDIWYQPAGSALKARLDKELSSNTSYVGESFTATIDMDGSDSYSIHDGATIRGHVSFVQPMNDGVPGILGIAFDEIVLSDGRTIPVSASSIDADTDIELNDSGRWVASPEGLSKNDLKFVGIDSSTSTTLVPLMTYDTPISMDDVNEVLPHRGEPSEVYLYEGTLIGIRIDQ